MNESLMIGLVESDVQAVVNTYDLKPFYYPTLFPVKETYKLTFTTLESQVGLKIAADLVARGSTIPKKVRDAIEKIAGSIPKIAISRELEENELTEYDIAVAMFSQNRDMTALIEFWAEDTEFCWTGIASKIEWMALRQISLGGLVMNQETSQGVKQAMPLDYEIPTTQKVGVSKSWDGTDADIVSDFKKAIKVGKSFGASYKYAFMNPTTLSKIVRQEQIVKNSASYVTNLIGAAQEPDLAGVNSYFAKAVGLNGIQIVIIDQDITLEDKNGDRVTGNPFEDDVVMLSEAKVLGRTLYKKPIDMNLKNSKALKVLRSHTLIKKWSEENPVKEVTQGIANAFPVWDLAGRSTLMQVNNTTWNKEIVDKVLPVG
ncbi:MULTISPECIES: major capsid protein [unclassified Empedobacter]|uniref:major capsid protein n=1 Tax=unclassified Empedobacter TaxID=2643773 RepID=UPI0025C3C779|nr:MULTISPECIES: major capsid protein [unclassified Empedobacter]